MFTVRFDRHSGGYEVYGCQRYAVSELEAAGTAASFREIRLFDSLEDTNPYCVQIGAEQLYMVAYVTNAAGKTVDRIV